MPEKNDDTDIGTDVTSTATIEDDNYDGIAATNNASIDATNATVTDIAIATFLFDVGRYPFSNLINQV